MISQKVREYIADHSFCSEYLFKDWESFLDLLYAEGGRVSSILWWDHCIKSQHRESAGSGGYSDPENDEFIIIIAEGPRFCKRRDECDSIFKKHANICIHFRTYMV